MNANRTPIGMGRSVPVRRVIKIGMEFAPRSKFSLLTVNIIVSSMELNVYAMMVSSS